MGITARGALAVVALSLALLCAAASLEPALLGRAIDRAAGIRPERELLVGTNLWIGYEPLHLARDLGYYGDAVRLVEYASATQVLRAMRNRTIDAAAVTLDEALMLRRHGLRVRVVLAIDISAGGDAIVARDGIDSVRDLAGRRVGVESRALGGYVLTRALERVSMSASDITVVDIEASGHEQAFLSGKVDAVVTFEPMRTRLLARGAHDIFSSNDIPGEIVDVAAVSGRALREQPDSVGMLVEGWFRALLYMEEHPGDAASRASARLRLNPEEVGLAHDGITLPGIARNRELMAGSPSPLQQTAAALAARMTAANLLSPGVDIRRLVDPRPIESLRPTPTQPASTGAANSEGGG